MKSILLINVLIYYLNSFECKTKRQISFPDEEPEYCSTPSSKRGVCEALVRCDRLLNSKNLNLLRQSMCGYDNEVPIVCCPLDSQVVKTTIRPKRRSTTTTTTSKPRTTQRGSVGEAETNSTKGQMIEEFPKKLFQMCGNTSVIQKTRIVGGKTSIPGSWPWMAAVFVEDMGQFNPQCGGVLVSDRHIITASHCVVEGGRVLESNRFRIRLGEHNIVKKTKDDAEVEYNVRKVTAHPQFDPSSYKNDIAIIHLSQKVPFNRRVWPICLPYDSKVLISEENIGRSGFITGWGRQEFNGRTSDVLREADVEIKSNEECSKAFERVVEITEHYICAGSMGSTKDSCQGDSGGPLMQIDPQKRRFYLTGVVSFGRRCATPGFPGVYARVSYFLDWISKNL